MFEHKSVLIIDDSDTVRTYLKNVLAPKGAVVEGAATGHEGLELCAQRAFDLILLDLIMPDSDGIEVLKAIRTKNDTSTVVMITGHGGIRSAIAAVQLGADGYIQKQDITATLQDHVEFLYALGQAMEHRAGIVAQKQLDQIRADFYSMITHDLRTPTTQIMMASGTLIDDATEPLTPRQKELVVMIFEAAERMMRLTSDYLDFAKLNAGYVRLELDEVDLKEVVETSVRFMRLQAQAKQLALTLDLPADPVLATVDAQRLGQVFDNLLSNAVKYTPENGEISVTLRRTDAHATVEVCDTGIGIAPDQLPHLFTKYHRIPGKSTKGISGTGLGLVIVKEIIEAHGGSVRVDSQGIPGQGTTFTFEIPLRPTAGTADASRSPSSVKPAISTGGLELPGLDYAELYHAFVQETLGHVQALQDIFRSLRTSPENENLLTSALRIAHTLKGNAGTMQLTTIYQLAARMESILRETDKEHLHLTRSSLDDLVQILNKVNLEMTDGTGFGPASAPPV